MRNFKVGEDAVSPIIGVVLMVGMTVVMISVVAVSVAFSVPESAPKAKIVIVEARGNIGNEPLHHSTIVLKHRGGDPLYENDTKIIITGKGYSYTDDDPHITSAQKIRVIYKDLTGENFVTNYDGEIVEGTSLDAGETITIYGSDGRTLDYRIQRNTVNSKWKLQSGSEVVVTVIHIPTNQVIAISRVIVKHS